MGRPVNDGAILEVTLSQRMNSQTLLNIFHYRLITSPGATVDGDTVVAILTAALLDPPVELAVNLKAASPANWAYDGLVTQWITPTRYTRFFDNTDAGAGALLSSPTPQNVAITTTKLAIEATRHGIGSFHLGGVASGDVLNGAITVQGVAHAAIVADAMMQVVDVSAAAGALTLRPVIFNRVTPSASLNWVEYKTQLTSRVERRRTVGLGI